ncbi:MAG: hypothetical protein ACHQT5_00180 [Candidatus Saccharimonadales bacterium]|jgi:hypothetical protein
MTRVLSELLGAKEPEFRLGLRQLERAGGAPSADIRLSVELHQAVQAALRELGLDPHDTTGPELYNALMERAKQDDGAIRELLGMGVDDADLSIKVQRLVTKLDVPKKTFALKSSVAKRLLKKNPPKKAMKQLGYRSLDSMLKHESVAQLYAAAAITEAPTWHRQLLNSYKSLGATDFESRNITIVAPLNKRWEKLALDYVSNVKHNIMQFKELGAVVLLPLPSQTVEGATLAITLLTLHAVNDIRTTSAYLKLHQVRPDFGELLTKTARSDPYTQASLLGEPLPWKLIHRYFAHNDMYNAELFEPHVQPEDLKWEPAESVLAALHDRLEFWGRGAYLALLDNGEPVSLNFTDVVLNFCNKLPYEQRIVHYFRDHLWHELMLRYLHQENLEQMVHEQLGHELVDTLELT